MKQTFLYGVLTIALFTGVAVGTPAHAEVASSTATTTSVTATTTVATTTATTTVVATTTTASSTSSHIADLLAQLAKLTAIFNDLKAKLFGVQAQIAEVKAGLHEGVSGEEVKSIQDLLASDPTIYPSGLKTGFFGPMTVAAIKKFQAKNGLEVTGEINAETKAALDTLMAQRRSEGHFPFGLLIAPGQHRDDFEHRLRSWCGVATSTAAASSTNTSCVPFAKKYHFEMEKHGSSTISVPGMMKGEHGKGKDMSKEHGNASSTDDDSEDDENDDTDDDN